MPRGIIGLFSDDAVLRYPPPSVPPIGAWFDILGAGLALTSFIKPSIIVVLQDLTPLMIRFEFFFELFAPGKQTVVHHIPDDVLFEFIFSFGIDAFFNDEFLVFQV